MIWLQVFFACHDPTTPGRQGDDIGPQYRSILVCSTEQQLIAARLAVDSLQLAQRYNGRPVLTEILAPSASSCSALTTTPSRDPISSHRPTSPSGNLDDCTPSDGPASDPSHRKTSIPLPHGVPFYAASDYHQSYYARHANDSSYLSLVVQPELERLSGDPSMRGLFEAGMDAGVQDS